MLTSRFHTYILTKVWATQFKIHDQIYIHSPFTTWRGGIREAHTHTQDTGHTQVRYHWKNSRLVVYNVGVLLWLIWYGMVCERTKKRQKERVRRPLSNRQDQETQQEKKKDKDVLHSEREDNHLEGRKEICRWAKTVHTLIPATPILPPSQTGTFVFSNQKAWETLDVDYLKKWQEKIRSKYKEGEKKGGLEKKKGPRGSNKKEGKRKRV